MHRLFIYLTLFLAVTASVSAQAQAPGRDPDHTRWISYAQTYFKIPIAQPGLYRITTAELRQAGVPVDQIDPTTVQLFHRGVEQAIYGEGETDKRFDAPDFIEFYGRANDGAQDSLLYRPHSAQPHTYYSLFNDTTAYFLTWRLDGKSGRRMTVSTDTAYTDLTPEPYHWEDELRLFTDNYPGWAAGIPPSVETSYYETGEGYTGVMQPKNQRYTQVFTLRNPVRTGPDPQVDVLLAGRSFTNHQIDGFIGSSADTLRQLGTVHFSVYNTAHLQKEMAWSDVGSTGQVRLVTLAHAENSATDNYSVSYIRLRYPQRLTANGQPMRWFRLATNPVGRSRTDITDVPLGMRFWDISDPAAPRQISVARPSLNSVRLVVPGTDTSRTLLGVSQPKAVPAIRPVTFTNWANRRPTYVIISHEALRHPINAVWEYARYRASVAGGGHDTLTVTMQQLFDQYSYGERHPLAIRRFTDQLLRQSKGSLAYLLLIGRSRSTPGVRRDPNQASLDMVMTAGFPGSDLVFTAGLNGEPSDVPAIPTGRINAETAQEVINYLDKVKAYESPASGGLWRKNLLHLSGGETPNEVSLFHQLVDTYRLQAVGPLLGAQVTTFSKAADPPVEPVNVVKTVNEGVGLITFVGHSGLDVTDLAIGFASSDALGYRNQGKYPLLLINGCAIGNFFYGRPTLATDWVLAPNRGAIAAIAQSHLGYSDVMHQYSSVLYSLFTDSTQLDKSIGQLQQETIRRILVPPIDGRVLANCQQMVLQGDPAIRLFPFKTPDYILTSGGLAIQDTNHQSLSLQSDSVKIRVVVQNAGQYRYGPLPVRVRRFVNGHETSVFNQLVFQPIAYNDTLILSLPNERDAEGQNQFEITVNPADSPSARPETDHTNNQAVIELTLSGQKPVLIYPAPGSTIKTKTVRLTAHYTSTVLHTFDLELDTTFQFNSPIQLAQRLTAMREISYSATLLTIPNTRYYWRIRVADQPRDLSLKDSVWVTGSFVYAPTSLAPGLPEGQIRLITSLATDIQQGDVIAIPLEFTNLSPYPFTDSLLVQQTIYAAGLTNPHIRQWYLKPPIGNDTVRFATQLATEHLPGLNRIVLTVNPRLQPEYSFQNNTLDLSIRVQPDTFGPLLEVAFDGTRITDGSVVSAQPLIDIRVADENRSLIRRDTTGLDLFLQRPGRQMPFERLSWRKATIQPTGPDNAFRLRYPLPKLAEGKYRLLVTARDAVGNPAVPYQVSFQVVSARRLTSFIVYPNPFRDQTRFAFTLTGDQAPARVTLTLTDVNGHVVRQLTQPNLVVRIGLNEWTWDGRSDAGALLPAGEYIYKLTLADPDDWPAATNWGEWSTGRLVLIR